VGVVGRGGRWAEAIWVDGAATSAGGGGMQQAAGRAAMAGETADTQPPVARSPSDGVESGVIALTCRMSTAQRWHINQ